MLRSSIVQYLNYHSDIDIELSARYQIIVKWFIGLPIEDRSNDHIALVDFRDKLGEKRWEILFLLILKQIEDAGFAKCILYVDATHVIDNIAIPGTIGLIRQEIKEVMEEPEKVDPELFQEQGGKKTVDKSEKVHTLGTEEKKKKLVDVVEEDRRIIHKVEKCCTQVQEKIELLRQVINENIEEKNNKIQKRKINVKYKVKDKLVSLVDKDASHGAKSDQKRFTGHKANSMMSEDGFIANIIVTTGNTYDSDVLISLVNEKIDNSSKPSKIWRETYYGIANNRLVA